MKKFFVQGISSKSTILLLIFSYFVWFSPNPSFAGFLEPNDNLKYADEYRVLYLDASCKIIVESNNPDDKFAIEQELGIDQNYNACLFILFDGSCYPHIEWARKQEKGYYWLLTRGNPMALEKEEGRRVYFDQYGWLAKQYHVQQIPTKVMRKGHIFIVEEVPLP